MSVKIGNSIVRLNCDSDICIFKLCEILRNERHDECIHITCHEHLIPFYAEKHETSKLISSMLTLYAGYKKNYIDKTKLEEIFKDVFSILEQSKNEDIYIYSRLIYCVFHMYSFHNTILGAQICEEISQFFNNPPFPTDKLTRDMYSVYNTIRLTLSNLSNDDQNIEKYSRLLLPNLNCSFCDQTILAFKYGIALYNYHRKCFREASKRFADILQYENQLQMYRATKCRFLYFLSSIISNTEINFSFIEKDSVLLNLYQSYNEHNTMLTIETEDQDIILGFSKINEIAVKKQKEALIRRCLKPYFRVAISFLCKETNLTSEEILDFVQNFEDYRIEEDYIIRFKSRSIDFTLAKTLINQASLSLSKRSPYFKVRFYPTEI